MSGLLAAGRPALDEARAALANARPDALVPLDRLSLLAPVPRPEKILCVGHNYRGHIGLGREALPEHPDVFCKTANAATGHLQPIVIPRSTEQVDYEAELAIVIGKRARHVSEADALQYVAGYTIINDVSARDVQKRTSQWTLGKSFDTFAPFGPALVTVDEVPDPHCLDLELTVNGTAKQRANTRDLIFTVPFLVAYLSAVMTLEPGDLIATGTPAKLPEAAHPQVFLKAGDVVEIRIEKLGRLVNPLAAEMRTN
jgi:acylpyruvate hydrolase